MKNRNIRDVVAGIIEENMHLFPSPIHDSDNLVSDLGMDSLDWLSFVIDIENEFDITIPHSESDKAFSSDTTFADAVRWTRQMINEYKSNQ